MTTTTVGSGRRSQIVKNLTIVYGTQIITMVLSILPLTYLPIYLHALGLGQLTIAESFGGILGTLVVLGSSNYIIREIASDYDRTSDVVSNAIVLRAMLALLLLPVAIMLPRALAYPSQTCDVILLIYVALFVRWVGEPAGLALQGLGKLGWRSFAGIVWKLTMVVLGWIVLVQGGGIIAYCVVYIVANAVEVCINGTYLMLSTRLRLAVHYQGLKQLFYGGLPFFLWVFLQMMYIQASSLLLSKLGGEVATGWYGAAAQLMLPLYSLPGVAIYVLLPQFSQIQLQSATEFRRILSRALNYVFLFTLPAALGVAVLASNIIDVFNYPATFQHSIPVLQLLAVSLPFTAVTMITATGISAMRRERSWAYVSLGSLIALICLGLILIPLSRDLWQNAAVGAAMAVLGSELVTIGMAWVLFGRLMIDRSFFTLLGKTLLATTVMTAVVMLSRHLPIAIPIMLGATTYGATVLLFKAIPEDDVQAAQAMIERRLRPALRALLAALRRNR